MLEPESSGFGIMEVIRRWLGNEELEHSSAFLVLKSITDTLSKVGSNEVTTITKTTWGSTKAWAARV